MKTIVLCLALGITLVCGCSAFQVHDPMSREQLAKIKNYRFCHSDWDCIDHDGEICTFVAIDTVAVCAPGSHDSFSGSVEPTTLVSHK
jgi:hypothetical protein